MAAPDLASDLQRIIRVSRALGSERDLGRLLELILREATALVEADRASLFLVDAARSELVTRIAQGAEEIRLPLGKGIAGTVAATGVAINIPSAYEDARFNPDNDRKSGYQTRSILCLPLSNHRDEVVAVIQVLNKQGGLPFGAHDEQVLSALCGQAAVAIDNAQLVTREREAQRLEREMELARHIQLGLLPDKPPEIPGWRFAAWSSSCDATGGDYHDFLPIAGGCDVALGDVSGHGIAAALLMSTARAFLRAMHGPEVDLGQLLTRMNTLLEQDMADDAFMSFVACRLGDDGRCALVNAGHEAPLFYRADRQGFDDIDIGGLLLGMLPDMVYDTTDVPHLRPGDMMVLFTDGIFEAQRPPEFISFGMDRMRQVIVQAAPQGAVAVRDAVVAAVDAWLGGHPPHDDRTLVVIERVRP